MEIAEFLLARIAEDEAAVVAVLRDRPNWDVEDVSVIDATPGTGDQLYVAHARGEYISRHIARHDPARVLAECEAKHEIAMRLRAMEVGVLIRGGLDVAISELRQVCQFLALPYADHPDYQPEWKV